MTETTTFPCCLLREKEDDITWFYENAGQIAELALRGFENKGPGVVVADATIRPQRGQHLITYWEISSFSQYARTAYARQLAENCDSKTEVVLHRYQLGGHSTTHKLALPRSR